jgi:hypothetical protein
LAVIVLDQVSISCLVNFVSGHPPPYLLLVHPPQSHLSILYSAIDFSVALETERDALLWRESLVPRISCIYANAFPTSAAPAPPFLHRDTLETSEQLGINDKPALKQGQCIMHDGERGKQIFTWEKISRFDRPKLLPGRVSKLPLNCPELPLSLQAVFNSLQTSLSNGRAKRGTEGLISCT